MEENDAKKFKIQHIENYRKAILENVKNNTNALVNDDIMSLLRKPPLDSMDLIKVKFLDLAKKNKIILNTEELSKILEDYRKELTNCCSKIKKIRIDELSDIVDKFSLKKDDDTIVLYKKDFISINKSIKKIIKEQLNISLEKRILKKIDSVFNNDIDVVKKTKIVDDITKYIKGSFQKQLLESFDIKILVKDTTLINSIKEQSERYLFTLNNSRLLNDL